MPTLTNREIALQVGWAMYGQPYRWGGDDTIDGFDCSGQQIEVLKSIGDLPRKGDWTAHSMMSILAADGREIAEGEQQPGDLAFFLNDAGGAFHVEMIFFRADLSLGASGGNSKTVSREMAAKQNAFVKVRPWKSRGARVRFFNPYRDEEVNQ